MKPYSEKSTVELKGWLTLYIFVLSVFLFCSILMFIYGIQKFKHEHYIMAVSAIVVGVVQLKIVTAVRSLVIDNQLIRIFVS